MDKILVVGGLERSDMTLITVAKTVDMYIKSNETKLDIELLVEPKSIKGNGRNNHQRQFKKDTFRNFKGK